MFFCYKNYFPLKYLRRTLNTKILILYCMQVQWLPSIQASRSLSQVFASSLTCDMCDCLVEHCKLCLQIMHSHDFHTYDQCVWINVHAKSGGCRLTGKFVKVRLHHIWLWSVRSGKCYKIIKNQQKNHLGAEKWWKWWVLIALSSFIHRVESKLLGRAASAPGLWSEQLSSRHCRGKIADVCMYIYIYYAWCAFSSCNSNCEYMMVQKLEETGRNGCNSWNFYDFSALRLQAFAAENCSTTPTPLSSRHDVSHEYKDIDTSRGCLDLQNLCALRRLSPSGANRIATVDASTLSSRYTFESFDTDMLQNRDSDRQCRLRIKIADYTAEGRLCEWVDLFFICKF